MIRIDTSDTSVKQLYNGWSDHQDHSYDSDNKYSVIDRYFGNDSTWGITLIDNNDIDGWQLLSKYSMRDIVDYYGGYQDDGWPGHPWHAHPNFSITGNFIVFQYQTKTPGNYGNIPVASIGVMATEGYPENTDAHFALPINVPLDLVRIPASSSQNMPELLVSKTEITQDEFSDVMIRSHSTYSNVGINTPAENVTWYDAILYCNIKSKREGFDTVYTYTDPTIFDSDGICLHLTNVTSTNSNGYRLPTKEEWEYAYLAGTAPDANNGYFWSSSDVPDNFAWYSGNATTTQTVGTKDPNAWGLIDMAGNVTEWTNTADASGNIYVMNGSINDGIDEMDYNNYWGPRPKESFSQFRGFRVVRQEYVNTILEEDFQNGLNSWEFYYNYQNACAMGYTTWDGYPNYVFYGAISADGEETWDVHLRKDVLQLVQGREYTFQFEARGIFGKDRDIHVVLEDSSNPYTNYSNAPYFHLTDQFQTFEYTFTMNEPTDLTAGICFEMGECSSDDTDIPNIVIIDNVKVIERY